MRVANQEVEVYHTTLVQGIKGLFVHRYKIGEYFFIPNLYRNIAILYLNKSWAQLKQIISQKSKINLQH